MTLADECAARVHDRARQAAARIINREEAMTAQDAAQGSDVPQGHPRAENGSTGHTGAITGTSGVEVAARVLALKWRADSKWRPTDA